MPKPRPFVVIKGPRLSSKQQLREMERDAVQFEDPKTVMRFFKGLSKGNLESLGWIAATKRGRRIIGRALKGLHRKRMRELNAQVAAIVKRLPKLKPRRKSKP